MTLSQLHRSQHAFLVFHNIPDMLHEKPDPKGSQPPGSKETQKKNKSGNTRPKGGNRRNKGEKPGQKYGPSLSGLKGQFEVDLCPLKWARKTR